MKVEYNRIIAVAVVILSLLSIRPEATLAVASHECDSLTPIAAVKIHDCHFYSDVVRQIAIDRDEGMLRQDVRISGLPVKGAFDGEINTIYDDPDLRDFTPNEIAAMEITMCKQIKRACPKQYEAALKKAEAQGYRSLN